MRGFTLHHLKLEMENHQQKTLEKTKSTKSLKGLQGQTRFVPAASSTPLAGPSTHATANFSSALIAFSTIRTTSLTYRMKYSHPAMTKTPKMVKYHRNQRQNSIFITSIIGASAS